MCEIPMFDEYGDDWTDEFNDFYNSTDKLIQNPGYFNLESITALMTFFDDTLNYDELMSTLVELVISIACFYGNDGLNKLLESFKYVKDKGKMHGKVEIVGQLMEKHYEEFKTVVSTATNAIHQDVKNILFSINAKNLESKKRELIKMLS